jgi:tetratricopeptide (TPR) repeat protein
VRLTDGEQAILWKRGTDKLQAYLEILQGQYFLYNQNPENNLKARKIFEHVIYQEPDYALAYSLLAGTHLNEVWLGTTKSPKDTLQKAAELSKKALSIDQFQGIAYGTLGQVSVLKKDWDKAIQLANKAIELEPNRALTHVVLGSYLCYAGRPEEAIPIIKKGIRLDPIATAISLNTMAIAYRMVGQYDKAIAYLETATQRYPDHLFSHLNLSACYILADRKKEAYLEAKEVLRLNPKFSIDRFATTLPLKNQEEKKRFIGALSVAFADQSTQ